MIAFFSSFFFIAAAEMGDKSQLVALAFATRFSARVVLAGIFAATLVVHLFSVVIGEVIGLTLPVFWVAIAAGLAFIGFGIWTIRGDTINDEDRTPWARYGPFFGVAVTFFVAELGDKTMLATVTLATHYREFVPVWIGSTLGMVVADAAAIIVGIVVGKHLPERAIRYTAAAIFILSGVLTIGAVVAQ